MIKQGNYKTVSGLSARVSKIVAVDGSWFMKGFIESNFDNALYMQSWLMSGHHPTVPALDLDTKSYDENS